MSEEEEMKSPTISKHVTEVVKFLEKKELRIDEKIAVCRAAGDLYQQVMV